MTASPIIDAGLADLAVLPDWSSPMPSPSMPLTHLTALAGAHGIYEHALGDRPRVEHGYCTDDAARVLAVLVREPRPTDPAERRQREQLIELSLSFLERAVVRGGRVHNRMSADGMWTDRPTIGDWWGRAVYGAGVAARHGSDERVRARALRVFLRAAAGSSPDVRACAFAAIGAADVLVAHPGATAARRVLIECLGRIPRPEDGGVLWPEQRLRYANGALCTALITGGDALGWQDTTDDGLTMLRTLLDLETGRSGLLAFVGPGGEDRDDGRRTGDQQPIEPAAIAEACLSALVSTGDRHWAQEAIRVWGWFVGRNDAGTAMFDPDTGAGYDGLEQAGRNENRGAESTLAVLGAHRSARLAGGWLT
ncbi:hypothetical protein J2Y69_003407 [Microbacterium resistens]|uniref:Glycosyltransferase n=1 Tax=Microbacterium resistens TaxID=156977 RepID=A0ABU1SGP9_9MICO|nr:glycosyltransferase [Microbacterium resistens]MDR6868783.1 hypothetical protein [Microbacterium resistens]